MISFIRAQVQAFGVRNLQETRLDGSELSQDWDCNQAKPQAMWHGPWHGMACSVQFIIVTVTVAGVMGAKQIERSW